MVKMSKKNTGIQGENMETQAEYNGERQCTSQKEKQQKEYR